MTTLRVRAYLAAHRFFGRIGLDISLARPIRDPARLLLTKATEMGAHTVLDVGANVGQFGAGLRRAGFSGTIVSFEPLSAAHARLSEIAAGDPAWHVAPRMALGERASSFDVGVLVARAILPFIFFAVMQVSSEQSNPVSGRLCR